jgi:hypothetical protein
MDEKAVFKVTFKGVILPGFDRDQVIENVFKITRIPKDTITRKFFSGKTVVIRHAVTQEYASNLQKTFAQAGIETNIEKVTDTVTSETKKLSFHDFSDIEIPENKLAPEAATRQPRSSKLLLLLPLLVIILVSIWYFSKEQPGAAKTDTELNSQTATTAEITNTSSAQPAPEQVIATSQTENGLQEKKSETTQAMVPQQALFDQSRVNHLVHFKQNYSWDDVSDFFALINLPDNFNDALNQIFTSSGGKKQYDSVWVFDTDSFQGILIESEQAFSESKDFSKLKTEIQPLSGCSDNTPFQLFTNEQSLLLISANPEISKNLNKPVNSFSQTLKSIAEQADENKGNDRFQFFYRSIGHDKLQLQIAVNDKMLKLNKHFFSNSELQAINKLTGLKDNTIKLSALNKLKLFDLSLLYLSQTGIPGTSDDFSFVAQKITSTRETSTLPLLKNYQSNLDIEHKVQWKKGPFAITTNSFQFSDQLLIELMSKGQNIGNFMEYSQNAYINVHSVVNKNQKNILYQPCHNHELPKYFFGDLDGEQEAFINDDFISYRTITALQKVKIQSGHQLSDVEGISGSIILKRPVKILSKRQSYSTKPQLLDARRIKIHTRFLNDKTIQYEVIGNHDYFLTIRAYDNQGTPLETDNIVQTSEFNNRLNRYQHSFNEKINKLAIFYTKQLEQLSYDYRVKPEIIVNQTILNTDDTVPTAFAPETFDLSTLNSELLNDNPDWLGKSVATSSSSPFYFNLFFRESNAAEDIQDAVFNIKLSSTSLISQSLTAVRLKLKSGNETLMDEYISFAEKEFFASETDLQPLTYLNANNALQFNKSGKKQLEGELSLNLPTKFKQLTNQYRSPGQAIKLDKVMVKPVNVTRQKIQFEITGEIDNVVQLRLYNKANELISEQFEFRQIKKDKALLTLLYNDEIQSVKLFLAESSYSQKYPIMLEW